MLTRSLHRPSGAGAAVVPDAYGPTASAGTAHTLRGCPLARSYTHSRNGPSTGAAAESAQTINQPRQGEQLLQEQKISFIKPKPEERASHLEHEVVRNVRLVRLYSLQHEGVPQVKERAKMHQDRMRQLRNIYRSFRKTIAEYSVKDKIHQCSD